MLGSIFVSLPKTVLHRIHLASPSRTVLFLIIAFEKDLRAHTDVAGVVKILCAIRLPPRAALANIARVSEIEENKEWDCP